MQWLLVVLLLVGWVIWNNKPLNHSAETRLKTLVYAVRGKTGCALWVVHQLKFVGCWPVIHGLTVSKCYIITSLQPQLMCWQLKPPAYRLECGNVGMAVDVSREGGGLQTLMISYSAMSRHNHSVSDCSRGWSTSDHFNRSWTNVERPWFLLRTDPASEKLGIISLSAVVQWVSWRTMKCALFL